MAKQEYIEKNRRWLQEKATESGVRALDKGIYYKVIRSGAPGGAQPGRSSVVTVHYTGRTINGKTFDSSRGGVAARYTFPPNRVMAVSASRVFRAVRRWCSTSSCSAWAEYGRWSMSSVQTDAIDRCHSLIPADAWDGSVDYLRKISNLAAPETPAPLIPLSILILFNPF